MKLNRKFNHSTAGPHSESGAKAEGIFIPSRVGSIGESTSSSGGLSYFRKSQLGINRSNIAQSSEGIGTNPYNYGHNSGETYTNQTENSLMPSFGSVVENDETSARLYRQLYSSLRAAKIQMNEYSNHIDSEWRLGFFRQIENLLHFDSWDPDDNPTSAESFRTFLRLVCYLKAAKRPGLSVTFDGSLVATWRTPNEALSVYCSPNDRIKWTYREATNNQGSQSLAGKCVLKDLPNQLKAILSIMPFEKWAFEFKG